MRTAFAALAAALAFASGVLAAPRPDEEKVPVDKLPKAVAAAVKKRFPKAEVVSAVKETDGKAATYEVTIKDAGVKIDVDVTADGTLTGFETAVALKDLPKAVAAAVAAKHPKWTAKAAESVTKVKDGKESLEYYEVTVADGGKDVEVEVLPDGTLKPAAKK